MAGRDWGWDAECSCGWNSRTGGAIQERVREAIADHRDVVRWNAEHPDQQIEETWAERRMRTLNYGSDR